MSRALVAITELETAEFFPGPMWTELQDLLPDLHVVRPPLDRLDWQHLWAEVKPEILISGWQTPSLGDLHGIGDLRYVCHVTGSVRHVVPRDLLAPGLIVTNWGSSIAATVAECVHMLILMALRRASYWACAMHRDGAWKDQDAMTQSLFGRRVGLHGFGAISRALVPLLAPYTSHFKTFSPRVPDELLAMHGVTRAGSLEELFATSDVLVELEAATPGNHHVVNEELLRMLPEHGVFVNAGRGSVVDELALIRVAREGRIQVALDVFEHEPLPPESALRGLPNVTLLPHLGGPTRDRRRDAGAFALRNLRAYLSGTPQEAVITEEVYDRST